MAVQGSMDSTIRSITTDSRQVKEGTLFIAVRGTRQDGHAFIEKAVEAGAAAVLCEEKPNRATSLAWVQVENTTVLVGKLAARFLGTQRIHESDWRNGYQRKNNDSNLAIQALYKSGIYLWVD